MAFVASYYMMLPVIPLRMMDQGFDNATIGFVIGLFAISSMIARPGGGVLVESYGIKPVIYGAIGLFFFIPILLLRVEGILGMAVSQIFYGLSIGGFTVAVTTYVSVMADAQTMARFIGVLGSAFVVAKGISPAIGVKLMEMKGFSWVVASTILFALLGLLLSMTLRTERPFVRQKDQEDHFFKVLVNPYVYIPTLVLFLGLVTFGAISAMLPVFAVDRGIEHYEYFFIINTCVVVFSRFAMWKIMDDHMETLVFWGMVALTISFILMAYVQTFWHLIFVALAYGTGFGILYPLLTSLLVLHSRGASKSMSLGIFSASFDLGVAAGSMLMGLSKYLDFKVLYLGLAFLPFLGLLLYQYKYRAMIRADSQ